ncbi:MAG: class I SAM-dependent methyltransferase [Actinomycetota bacterium]
MSDEWDAYADSWDDMEATTAYANAAFASLSSILDGAGIELSGTRVVDFGCGTGLLTAHLAEAGASVVGVDTSAAMLAVLDAKIEERGWSGVTTASTLDGVMGGNDVIACSSVCAFLDDYPGTVAQLATLLRPGGLFIQWDWERDGDDDHGLTRHEIREALVGAGLHHVEVRTAFAVEAEGEMMQPLAGYGRRAT